jgi:arylsulfatase A-like enzyme
MYSTDNGPENDTWPDGGNTPFRAQKDTNWEGAWRVPTFLRWPGKIKAGSIFNGICSHIDLFPTLLAAAGDPDVKQKLLDGCTVGQKTFKVHLDGYNLIPYLTGAVKESPRNQIMYFSDDGELMAVRVGDYKFNLSVQRAERLMQWAEPLVKMRLPLIFNLRRDPLERAELNSNTYLDWLVDPPGLPDASDGGGGDRELHQVPAAPETGFVQPGRGVGAGLAARWPCLTRRSLAGIADWNRGPRRTLYPSRDCKCEACNIEGPK